MAPTPIQERMEELHREIFAWCGDLSAKSGELMARCNELAVKIEHLTIQVDGIAGQQALIREFLADTVGPEGRLEAAVTKQGKISAAVFDDLRTLRTQLLAVRETDEYEQAFEESEPLVTVRIATYNRPELLLSRAVPSILAQTYPNIEVVIVGDGCQSETGERIAALGDSRIRYENLPHRGLYPADPVARWQVAGTSAANHAAQLSRGRWIAPFDEDDEMTPDHVEALLAGARSDRFEMVYGRLEQRFSDGTSDRTVGAYPPREGQFNLGGALYMTVLRFFECDPNAWVINEPGDWHLCKQMANTGVRIGYLDRVVTTLHVTGPRPNPSDSPG